MHWKPYVSKPQLSVSSVVVTATAAVLPDELQLLLPGAAVGTVRQPVPCSPD